MILPKIKKEQSDESLFEIQSIESLYDQFIVPIDRIRSLSRVSLAINSNDPEFHIENDIQESRCHAFYRMIGLPVVSNSNQFYNPGFGIEDNATKDIINKDQHLDTLKYSYLRENYILNQKNIFQQQSKQATDYTLSLRNIKPFNIFELTDYKFTIEKRTGVHYLFPLSTDGRICEKVAPDYFQVCVPFLANKNQTQISNNKFLTRSILEFVLIQRLKLRTTNSATINQFKNIFKDLDLNEVFLNEQSSIDNLTTIEVSIISNLLKTIKSIIDQIKKQIKELNFILTQTNFSPIIHKKGPEFGGTYINSVSNATLPLDLKIQNININKIQLESLQQTIETNDDFYFQNIGNTNNITLLSNELDTLLFQRSFLNKQGINYLKNIEIVTGEISGLGLIDILSIYSSLWAMDINSLINLLDNSSFNRLYKYNPALRSQQITNRFNGQTINISAVLQTFQNLISEVLTFANEKFKEI